MIRQRGRHTSISGSSRLGTALCTSVLANPAFALLSRIRLKAPAPSATKVLSLEMKSELKTLVQSDANRKTIMKRLTSQDLLLLDANDIYRLCQGGDIVNPNMPNNPAYAIPRKLRVAALAEAVDVIGVQE